MARVVIQCADTGPLDSLVYMFEAIGYECVRPTQRLLDRLSRLGGLVLSPSSLQAGMGYEPPQLARTVDDIRPGDVYVDVKAHQTYSKLVETWPHLDGRVLWYRINGGEPEHVIDNRGDHGDEVNPPCPVVTPNQWYKDKVGAYTFWPKLIGAERYTRSNIPAEYKPPVCFIHNVHGWGYGSLITDCVNMGVRIYGRGSPAGLINHREVPDLLRHALCMVHLKTSDAPGYALLESLAAGCPIILPRRLIRRCAMDELFRDGVNCLVFDGWNIDMPWDQCAEEIRYHLKTLDNPHVNHNIGMNGRNTYRALQWDATRDAEGFNEFIKRQIR